MLAVHPAKVFPRAMARRIVSLTLWLCVAFWAGCVLWLSSLTPRELPDAAFLFSDKLNHFVAFAVGGWLAASALRVSRPRTAPMTCILMAICLVAAFGASDELLQKFTPGRSGGDLYDWIADFLGAITGALLTLTTHARLERFLASP